MDTEALAAALDEHDEYVRQLALGRLSLPEFLKRYDNFYWSYALDGHEAEPTQSALSAHASRIDLHRQIADEVMAVLAPESSAAYHSAGRIGPTEALERLKLIARGLPAGGA